MLFMMLPNAREETFESLNNGGDFVKLGQFLIRGLGLVTLNLLHIVLIGWFFLLPISVIVVDA